MSDRPPSEALPFRGVRILDLAAPVSAYCARILAGYGADVLRLERPGAGVDGAADPRRPWLDAWYAAGCRRATLDFADDRAVPLLAELAATVDVVIASPDGGHARSTGFVDDPLGLAWCGPSVVTCFLTPFGATGPLRNWRATPLTAHAMSGLMFADRSRGGAAAVDARASALGRGRDPSRNLHRGRAARAPAVGGQVLDVAAHEVMASQDDMHPPLLRRRPGDAASGQLRACRRAGRGPWPTGIIDIAVNTPGHWESFVKTMGSPPELTDEMWQDRTMRIQLHDVLSEIVAGLLATSPSGRARSPTARPTACRARR